MSDFVDGLRAELVSAAEREQVRRMPRVSRPAPRLILVTAVAAAMLAIVVLSTGGLRTEPDRSATPKPEPTPDGRPLFGGSLEEGVRFRTREFVPALSFVATGPKWVAGNNTAERNTLTLLLQHRAPTEKTDRAGVGLLSFVRFSQVYDPGVKSLEGSLVTAPADLYAWLRAHPDLRVGAAEPVTVAGVPGQRFAVDARFSRPAHSDPSCRAWTLLKCTFLAPNASVLEGTFLRFTILRTEPDPLMIVADSDTPQQLRELEKAAAPLLDTLRIGVR